MIWIGVAIVVLLAADVLLCRLAIRRAERGK